MLWIVAAAIGLITYFSFAPSLNCGFTNWDDDTYVTGNSLVISKTVPVKEIFTTPVALNYHPITVLTLAWNYQQGRLNPRSYHSTNLIIHVLNTILVFFFIYFLCWKKIWVSIITAMLFGIHPMHVESVTWISERKDVLYVFFFLASLLFYLRYTETKKILFLALCFLLFVFSCLSKAMAVVLPLVLLLVDYFRERKTGKNLLLEILPFFAVSLVLGIIALRIQSGSAVAEVQSFTFFHRILFGCYGTIMYLIKFILPVHLSAFYPYPVADGLQSLSLFFYLAPLVLIGGLYFIYHFFRQQRFVVFGVLFFIVTIALVLQFISVGNAMMADRYSYLSYIGLAFIAGNLFELLVKKYSASRVWISTLMVACIGWFCILTNLRTKTWTNSDTLWSDVIQKYPAAATAYKNRGNYYGQQGKMDEALKDYKVLLSMNTKDPEVYNNLANIYAAQNQIDESLNASSKAIALKPNYANAYLNRGITYSSVKKYKQAIDDFSKAISINPKNVQSYLQRGLAYYADADFQQAVNDFSQVLLLQPNSGAAYYYRGLSGIGLHDNDAALRDLQQAQQLGYEGDYSMLKSVQ